MEVSGPTGKNVIFNTNLQREQLIHRFEQERTVECASNPTTSCVDGNKSSLKILNKPCDFYNNQPGDQMEGQPLVALPPPFGPVAATNEGAEGGGEGGAEGGAAAGA